MPADPNNINFWTPQAILAPDLTVEQQQIDRRRALAQALQAQALQNDIPEHGAYSWTQGVAKITQGIAAALMNRKADKQQAALNQAYAGRLGPAFGGQAVSKGGDPAQPSGDGSAVTPAVTPSPSFSAAFNSPAMAAVQGGQSSAPIDQPQSEPQQPYQPGPLSLTGNPQQDMAMYAMGGPEYIKAVLAAHAPTDFNKLVAQSGIDPNSPLGRQIMQSQIAKQNYIAPINGRPGSTIRDPNDPSRVLGYDAPNIEGAFPIYGANGMPIGYQQAPGAAGAIGAVEGAKAGASAAARAPFDLVTVTDANGNQYQIPKSAITGGASPRSAPATGGGSLGAFYGQGGGVPGGVRSGMGPGETEASKISAKNFSDAVAAGSNSQQANFQLDRIGQITRGLPTGTGSGLISEVKSAVNAATGHNVFDADRIAKFDELKKISSSLAQSLSTGAGMNGTDARLQAAIDALPNSNYSPQAIQSVVGMLKGLQTASLARGNAAAAWQTSHGANTFPDFQRQWQANYDPVLFENYAKGPQAFAKWAGSLSADQRAAALRKYQGLKAMGAF